MSQKTLTDLAWRCGKCGKVYSSILDIPDWVWADPKNKKKYGKLSRCDCGYVFHKDKWVLKSEVKLVKKGIFGSYDMATVEVSTVDLELNHFGCWYETMVFTKESKIGNLECGFQTRYKTKKEANLWHKKIVKKLQSGNYEIKLKTFYGGSFPEFFRHFFLKRDKELVF